MNHDTHKTQKVTCCLGFNGTVMLTPYQLSVLTCRLTRDPTPCVLTPCWLAHHIGNLQYSCSTLELEWLEYALGPWDQMKFY